ncbi:MAG: adenylosuccinate synthetase, partial [Pseudomonadota bacterium]
GWFDLITIQQAKQINSITHLIITKLDVLSGLKTIKVCTAYTYEGKSLPCFPTDLDVLEKCTPVYEELEGWEDDLTAITRFDDLPKATKNYIFYLENKTGIPVSMVSVGSRRDQIITLHDPFSA